MDTRWKHDSVIFWVHNHKGIGFQNKANTQKNTETEKYKDLWTYPTENCPEKAG